MPESPLPPDHTEVIVDDLGREQHERLMGQKGVCVWLTGLSASGKTSIARVLERTLHARHIKTYVLDGDVVRQGMSQGLGFTAHERDEHVRRVGEVARLFVDAGLVVICALISPYRGARRACRDRFPEGRFIECHVSCSLDVCQARDHKGLYERARKGLIEHFTGISAPYEPPTDAELVLHTDRADASPQHCARQIIDLLVDRDLLTPPATRA